MEPGPLVALVAAVLGVWLVMLAVLWAVRPRDADVGQIVRIVPDLVRLGRNLLADRTVPRSVRLALVGLLAWLLNPIDLVPEFIPVLGPLDDVIVAVLVLRFVGRRLGQAELRRRWPGTDDGFERIGRLLR
jgi:uncharacterized membrane protein YkvA (DUF1232 family)